MSDEGGKLRGPDLTKGVPLADVKDGAKLLGHAEGEPAILVRHGEDLFAIGAVCTHYGADSDEFSRRFRLKPATCSERSQPGIPMIPAGWRCGSRAG